MSPGITKGTDRSYVQLPPEFTKSAAKAYGGGFIFGLPIEAPASVDESEGYARVVNPADPHSEVVFDEVMKRSDPARGQEYVMVP